MTTTIVQTAEKGWWPEMNKVDQVIAALECLTQRERPGEDVCAECFYCQRWGDGVDIKLCATISIMRDALIVAKSALSDLSVLAQECEACDLCENNHESGICINGDSNCDWQWRGPQND